MVLYLIEEMQNKDGTEEVKRFTSLTPNAYRKNKELVIV